MSWKTVSLCLVVCVLLDEATARRRYYSCKVNQQDIGQKIKGKNGKVDDLALIQKWCSEMEFLQPSTFTKGEQIWPNCTKHSLYMPIMRCRSDRYGAPLDHLAIFAGECTDHSFQIYYQDKKGVAPYVVETKGPLNWKAKDFSTIVRLS